MKLLALDVDGVITDGVSYRGANGTELKSVRFRDVDAAHAWKRNGGYVALLSGEDNELVDEFGEWFGCNWVLKGQKDKLDGLNRLAVLSGITTTDICYVGDSDRDAPALSEAGFACAPRDATDLARQAADVVLTVDGGHGCVHETVQILMRMNQDMPESVSGGNASGSSEDFADLVQRRLTESAEALAATSETLADKVLVASQMVADSISSGGTILVAGNGGSASQAQHFAGELVGRFTLERRAYPVIALTADSTILTSIGNDYSYDEVFSRQVEAYGSEGGVFIGLSTSGNSANVVAAAELALKQGMKVIALTTGTRDSKLQQIATLCIGAPSASTPRIQECHIAVIHAICEAVERMLQETS